MLVYYFEILTFKLPIISNIEQKFWFFSGFYFSVYVTKHGGFYSGDMKCIFLFLMKIIATASLSKNWKNKCEILSTIVTHLALNINKVRFLLAYGYMILTYTYHLPYMDGAIEMGRKGR